MIIPILHLYLLRINFGFLSVLSYCRHTREFLSWRHCENKVSKINGLGKQGCRGYMLISKLGHIAFVGFYYEIISTVILVLPLIQEEQLSSTGKSMCTKHQLTA